MVKFRYTDEMKVWLRTHSKGVPYDELAPQFNAVFGLNKTARQIQSACHDHGAHNGLYKIPESQVNHKARWRPVGSTRLDKDGFVRIKISGSITSMLNFMRGREAKGKGFNIGTAIIIAIILIIDRS